MNNHKKVMLSLALVAIIAVAAMGIGYAYTASTTNKDNSAAPEYIILKQGGDGEYQFAKGDKVFWNTDDYRENEGTEETPVYKYYTDYTLTSATVGLTLEASEAADEQYILAQVGKSFQIKAEYQDGGAVQDGLNVVMTSSDLIKPTAVAGTDLYIIIKVVDDATTPNTNYYLLSDNNKFKKWNSTTGWGAESTQLTFPLDKKVVETVDVYATSTITFYYGYELSDGKITVVKDNNTDSRQLPSSNPLNNAKLTFKVTATGDNTETGIVAVSSISISDDTMVKSTTKTLEVTFNGGESTPSNKFVRWYSSNPSVASVNEFTGLITAGASAGTVTITAVSVDNPSATDTCTLTITNS